MAYRDDSDLEFLGLMKSEELNDLVYCLTHDKDGETRLTEELTMDELYKQHYPDHAKYWKSVAAEIQCFGANSFATMLRGGKGVEYKEILIDVCDKLKVNYNKKSSTEKIESNLLMKILTDAIEKMSQEEIKELAEATGLQNTSIIGATSSSQKIVLAFQAVFRAGGFKSYQLTVIIANIVLKTLMGRGLSFAANATLTRTMALLTGPMGFVVTTAVWTAIDIAGAAYRVTIPAVIQVAVLRQKHLCEKLTSEVSFS